jgi:hypothetical protein
VASRDRYVTPLLESVSMAKQYTPSPAMAGVMFMTVVPVALTAPAVASIVPSSAGWVFHVTVLSFHAQPDIAWIRPPESLPALPAPLAWR